MTRFLGRLARIALAVSIALPVLAQDLFDQPPFSAEPKALLDAAAKVTGGKEGVVILLDEMTHSFETDGTKRSVERMLYRIDEQSAVEPNGVVTAYWSPWFDEKPVITARVITKDGSVHTLDAAAVTEAPANNDWSIFSDSRILRAPLPAVAVGSVVEYTVTTGGRSPIEGAGTGSVFYVSGSVPAERSRLILDGPVAIQPRFVNHLGVEPKTEEAGGRRRVTFTVGRTEKLDNVESYVPFDDSPYRYAAFSTGTSWQDIATRYAKIVDQQIAGSDLKKLVKSAVGDATRPRDIAVRALAAIEKDIRYAGVEVAEGSIVPRPPATVLKNKYGDCKDKATLLVAMLREAGLTAHVALLRAGSDLDTHSDLPGLARFNHAIVRMMDGKEELWIDPTDEFARAGELPTVDQGRMALVAAPETTSLTKTPEFPSSSNHYTETRVFTLTEYGKPPVVETTEATGPSEAAIRRYRATTTEEKYREGIEDYAESYYYAKELESLEVTDPRDMDKPFRLTLTAKESGNGWVGNGQASVAIHPSALIAVPDDLRNWKEPQPDDDPDDAPKPRVHDFVIPAPFVKEWTYRIVPPAGYVARTLPDAQTRKLGTTTFTAEYTAQPDGVVVGTLRFDSGKRRLTPKEYEETRVAISKFLQEPQTNIGFDLIGQAKLSDGDVAGALAEFRRLAAMHPKEAQHHIELAKALLAGGLGEPARAEAHLAVKIEPKNARAHQTLGETLEHDLLGRKFRTGWDRDGALASLRKAKELDSENLGARVELARLLTYGTDGIQFDPGGKLADAAAEYRAIDKDFGEDGHEYDGELMMVLAYAEKFDELKDLAAATENGQRRDVGRLLAVAAAEGRDAAVRELGKFDVQKRRTYAGELAKHLMNLRRYPEAAAMFELASQGTAAATKTAQLVSMLQKTKRLEVDALRTDDPIATVPRMFATMLTGDTDHLLDLIAPDIREEARRDLNKEGKESIVAMRSVLLADRETRPSLVADLFASMIECNKDGDDVLGYRIRCRAPNMDKPMSAYATKHGQEYFLQAFEDDDSVGLSVLHFVDRNELDRARIWLNWARDSVTGGDAEDPLSRPAFAMAWTKAKQTATAEEIRLAAAAQMADHTDDKVDVLVSLRDKAATDADKLVIDVALAKAYSENKRWKELLPVAQRLFAAHPDSRTAFNYLGQALYRNGRNEEASALAKKRLEQLPRDRDALRILAGNAGATRDYAAAAGLAQQVLDETTPEADDFNNAAWYGLLAGNLDKAVTHALQANEKEKQTAGTLHTLASVYAESDKPLQAREALLSSMGEDKREQPKARDWYVLGRIAETYGVREAAVAAYNRVPKANEKDFDADVAELVARRVAKLK